MDIKRKSPTTQFISTTNSAKFTSSLSNSTKLPTNSTKRLTNFALNNSWEREQPKKSKLHLRPIGTNAIANVVTNSNVGKNRREQQFGQTSAAICNSRMDNKENMSPNGAVEKKQIVSVKMREKEGRSTIKCCNCPAGKSHKYVLKKADRLHSMMIRGRNDFADIFDKSDVLIDRTKFLLRIIEVRDKICKNILITMPSGAGKSWLAGMTRAFFDDYAHSTPDKDKRTKNRNIFLHKFCQHNPHFFVARTENGDFFTKHQGKYSVIHFDFKNLTCGEPLANIILELAAKVATIFQDVQHSFMNRINEEEKNGQMSSEEAQILKLEYWEYRNKNNLGNISRLKIALNFLLRQLHHWNPNEAIVIIDEYDKPIYQNGKTAEWKEIIEFVAQFVGIFVDNEYVHLLLVFGRYRFPLDQFKLQNVFEVGFEDDRNMPIIHQRENDEEAEIMASSSSILANSTERKTGGQYRAYWRQQIAECFGFLDGEIDELFDSYKFGWREKAKEWYNGHALSRIPLYSSNSILQMLNHWQGNYIEPITEKGKLFISYFDEPKIIMHDLFCPIFRAPNISPHINALINGPVKLNISKFDITKMEHLLKHAQLLKDDEGGVFDPNAEELFLSFLHTSGYIVPHLNGCYFIIIPNDEMRRIFQNRMLDFYFETPYKVTMNYYNGVTKILRRILFGQIPDVREKDKKRGEDKDELISSFRALLNAVLDNHSDEMKIKFGDTNSEIKIKVERNEHNLHVAFETCAYRLFGWNFFAGDYPMRGGKIKNSVKAKTKENEKKRPDLILCSESRGVAFCAELKFGDTAQKWKRPSYAIGQILANKYVQNHPAIESMQNLRKIVVLGLNGHQKMNRSKMSIEATLEYGERKINENVKQFLARFQNELENNYKNDVQEYKKYKRTIEGKGKK